MTPHSVRPAIARVRAALATALAAGLALTPMAFTAPQCEPVAPMARIPELSEASGLTVGKRTPGRLWAHNDSGQPVVFALDTQGHVSARLRVTGATVVDWEAIGVGPCPAGSCLYIGDIGDNSSGRPTITVYRVPEPEAGASAAAVSDVYHASYPDGAHDAETLLVTPSGELFVVTKGDPGVGALYRFPRELRTGITHRLELVGSGAARKTARTERITDGSVSMDGAWVVLRTGQRLDFHRSDAFLSGDWSGARSVDLRVVGETQGEAVAFAAERSVFLAGEGGGQSRAGTFVHLTCTLD